MERFIENQVKHHNDTRYRALIDLLHNPNIEFNLFANKSTSRLKQEQKIKKSNRIINSKIKKIIKSRARSSSKSKSTERGLSANPSEDLNLTVSSRRESFYVFDYSVDVISSQLTLIEWDNFLDIHVCHCLNSKAQGVKADTKQPIDPNNIANKQCLFVDNYLSKSVYKMIQFNYLLAHWVSAEILMCDNLKVNYIEKNIFFDFIKKIIIFFSRDKLKSLQNF